MSIESSHLAAYFNAAIAVAAFAVDLRVQRVRVELYGGRRGRPRLMLLAEYVRRRSRGFTFDRCIREYVMVLLAGTVGRALAIEAELGLPAVHPERSRLKRAYRLEAQACREPETDRAYATVVASFDVDDHHDVLHELGALWEEADRLLSSDINQRRLGALVEALKQREVLVDEQITAALR